MARRTGILSLFRQDFRLRLFLEGSLIGALVGILIVAFRFALEKTEELRGHLYVLLRQEGLGTKLLWFLALVIIGLILSYIIKKVPMSGGSGIPQVKGILLGRFKVKPVSLIAGKFIGGVLGIGAGLSLGREGPSIQLGAAVSQLVSRSLGRLKIEEKYLVTCGASAGLAAAFNAPLAGVIFSLEELHKNFSPSVLMSSMAAALSADVVAQFFYGQNPVFKFQDLLIFPLKYYFYLVGLGIICGLLGVLFNKSLLKVQDYYQKSGIPLSLWPIFPLLLAGGLGFVLPEVLGGGNNLVQSLSVIPYSLAMLALILVVKFIFTMLSYGSGVPGGIFLPLLVLGALAGDMYSQVVMNSVHMEPALMQNFMVYAMAAYFTAIVKAPVTGSILITEMTGSFHHLLPLILVSMTAYVIADLLKSESVYELLYEKALQKEKNDISQKRTPPKASEMVIHEFVVSIGSQLAGKRVKDIKLPARCLLVSIKRGNYDIIPNGETLIQAGDYVHALVEEDNLQAYRELSSLTEKKARNIFSNRIRPKTGSDNN
jgi:H+/Cl- antiporter ClcA